MAEADPRKTFAIDNAGEELAALLESAVAGEIELTREGRPIGRLVRYPDRPKKPRQPGAWKGLVSHIPDSVWFDPLPEEELALWEGRDKKFD